jgi:hypothetical protein
MTTNQVHSDLTGNDVIVYDETANPGIPLDGCPDWACDMISKIVVLEVEAGTIKNPNEGLSQNGWSTANLEELAKAAGRLDASGHQIISEEVEALFRRVVAGLVKDSHSFEAIAAMINVRIPTGCRLAYCSADEVRDAVS